MPAEPAVAAAVRGVSAPTLPLPPLAWDTHAHVFGPFDRYPLTPDCRYQPPFAPEADYRTMMAAAGFDRGVLVHASANGFDNSAVLDAVAHGDGGLKAIAVVAEDVSDAELARLHAAGVRGLRFTETGETLGGAKPVGVLGLSSLRVMAPRLKALGWCAQIWAGCEYLVESQPWLATCGIPLVVDHMGHFDVTKGVGDATFQGFLAAVRGGSTWVKLTAPRVSKLRWDDCADVRPFHEALLEAGPDRMVWGSDWPFIGMDNNLPDMGGLIDLFDRWTPDPALRQKVFVTNPQVLFGGA